MELPYDLKTLEPLQGALDILRYLGEIEAPTADADEICDALNISSVRFGKAIRRLVTQSYVVMDGAMTYRLADRGHKAVEILAAYDAANPPRDDADDEDAVNTVLRHLVVALPQPLVAQAANTVVVGVAGAVGSGALTTPADLVLRLSVVNGQPSKPVEAGLVLGDDPAQHSFSVTPDAYQQVRIRVQVFQLGPNPDDITVAGGLYVDADVTGAAHNPQFVAYGGTLAVQLLE